MIKARFHFPDFTRHLSLNLLTFKMIRSCPEWVRDGVEIASVYGVFPPALWGGGRPQGGLVCDEDTMKRIIKTLNDDGIPLRFTFTNPLVTKEHLSDPFCNRLLQIADNGFNEVIVFSEVLEDYIRKNYPRYKITSSTCKRLTNPEDVARELNRDYHVVVLDYDLNNQWEILDSLPHKEKCELLINSACFPHCPKRSAEYEAVGAQQIAYNEHLKRFPGVPFRMSDYSDVTLSKDFNCPAMHRTPFDARKLPHHISPDLIWNEYLPRGFNQFKIEGRGGSRLALIEAYIYYLIKPEYQDEARFMLLHNLERNKVIQIDDPVYQGENS